MFFKCVLFLSLCKSQENESKLKIDKEKELERGIMTDKDTNMSCKVENKSWSENPCNLPEKKLKYALKKRPADWHWFVLQISQELKAACIAMNGQFLLLPKANSSMCALGLITFHLFEGSNLEFLT